MSITQYVVMVLFSYLSKRLPFCPSSTDPTQKLLHELSSKILLLTTEQSFRWNKSLFPLAPWETAVSHMTGAWPLTLPILPLSPPLPTLFINIFNDTIGHNLFQHNSSERHSPRKLKYFCFLNLQTINVVKWIIWWSNQKCISSRTMTSTSHSRTY